MPRKRRRLPREVVKREPSLAEKLQANQTQVIVRQQMMMRHETSGPLPPSAELAAYEDIHPGIASRLLGLTETGLEIEREDRKSLRELQKSALAADTLAVKRGQLCALAVSLCGLAITYALAMGGHPGVAVTVAGTTIVVLVGSFLGTRQRGEKKAEETKPEETKPEEAKPEEQKALGNDSGPTPSEEA